MADSSIPEKTTLEKLLGALTKTGDATLNLASKKIGIDTGITQKEIFKGEKDYSPRSFLDDVGKKFNVDLKFGDEDKTTQADKALNFATEFALGVVTDPLSLLTEGSSGIAKQVGKYAKVSEPAVKRIARAITGGTIGALTGDDVGSAVTGGLVGAGVGAFGGEAIRGAGRLIDKKLGEPVVDSIAKMTNPVAHEGTDLRYSQAFDIARQAEKRTDDITRQMREISNPIDLDSLAPEKAREIESFLDSTHSSWHTYRNKLEAEVLAKRSNIQPIYDTKTIDIAIPDGNNGLYNKTLSVGRDKLILQDSRYKDSFGARHIIEKDGDKYIRYSAFGGKNTFLKMAESKSFNRVLNNETYKRSKILNSIEDFNKSDAIKHGLTDKNGKAIVKMTEGDLNILSTKTNTYIGKLVDEQLAREGDEVKTRLVKQWVDRNRKMIDVYNKERMLKYGAKASKLVPIDFHTLEIKPKINGMRSYDNIVEGFVRRSSDAPIETGGLTLKERMGVENERFRYFLYSDIEKEADRLLYNVKYVKPSTPVAEKLFKFVDGYDKFTRFLKQQHLTFSHTWIMNNYIDNLSKAYMKGGKSALWDTLELQTKAALRDKSSPLVRDLLRLTDPDMIKAGVKFNDELTEIAKKSGAISEGLFSESFARGQISKELLISKVGVEEATKIMADAANRNTVSELADSFSQFLGSTVGRTGSLIESAARLTTFKHHADTLFKSKEALQKLGISHAPDEISNALRMGHKKALEAMPSLQKVYDEASRVTNETFFDYSNISSFEEQVMKRIFPYWTYFSKNFPQWIDMATENPSAFRNLARTYTTIGRKQTDRERKSTPDYKLDLAPRIVDGKQVTVPSTSILDSLNATTGDVDALSKVHPLLKLGYQIMTGKNEFGNELYPSRTKTGQVRVFGAGEKFAPFTDSIYRDRKRGNKLYTDSDLFQLAKTVQSNLLPVPAIDTIAKALNKIKEGTPASDALTSLSPVKIDTPDRLEEMRVRMFRDREANFERQKLNDINNAKRLSK